MCFEDYFFTTFLMIAGFAVGIYSGAMGIKWLEKKFGVKTTVMVLCVSLLFLIPLEIALLATTDLYPDEVCEETT